MSAGRPLRVFISYSHDDRRHAARPAAAREHLDAARALIAETGYHRRDAELAALSAAAGM